MDGLIGHPPWCRRMDCSTTGRHVSKPQSASNAGDLLGIEATLVQLDTHSLTLVELALTDEGETTIVSLPVGQARSLEQILSVLVAS